MVREEGGKATNNFQIERWNKLVKKIKGREKMNQLNLDSGDINRQEKFKKKNTIKLRNQV